MSALEHTDPAFAPDTPALTTTEPSLAFVRASHRGFASGSRQNDPPDTARKRGIFVLGRGEATIGGRDIWSATEDRDMSIERRGPERHVGRSRRMDLICRDDLMLAFLDGHELPELGRLGDLAFPDGLGMRFEDTENFVRYVRVAADQARAGLSEHPRHQWRHPPEMRARLPQSPGDWGRRRPQSLADATHDRRGVANHGARRRHQLPIAPDQCVPCLRRSCLSSNDQHATADAASAIAYPPATVTQRHTRALHRAGHNPHTVLQQRAVRRVMHIRFYDRGVDAKSTAVRD